MNRKPLSFVIAALLASAAAQVAADPATAVAADAAATAPNATDAAAAKKNATAKGSDSVTSLESITVTARRRAELLQDVPIAVTALSATALQTQNIQSLNDLAGNVPNLVIHDARGSNSTITTYIRGVGQSDPTWGSDPGVGIYLDDVYIARPQGALLDVFDVQRIEVLRGPQGTLYGKNTIGGAIKYVSRDLPTQDEGYAQVDAGNEGRANLKLGLGGATDDGQFRARVAYASLHHDGYGENLNTGDSVSNQNTNAGRISAGFFPKDVPVDFQFSADTVHDNSNPRGARMLAPNKFTPTYQPLDSDYDVRSGMPSINPTHMVGESFRVNLYANDAWTFKSITAHRQSNTLTNIDFDTTPLPIADVQAYYRDSQTSQEFQANYQGNGGTSGVVGFYYFDGTAAGWIHNNFFNALFGVTGGKVDTRSYAAYTDWTWSLAERWQLSAGARFTDEKKHAIVNNYTTANASFGAPVAVTANFDRSRQPSNFSPRLSLLYKLNDETNLYASLARGFKSGSYNIRANTLAVPVADHPVADEVLDTFEFGSKSSFDDGRFALNADVFYTRYRDIQLSVFTSFTQANGTPGFYGDFTNAGKAHAYGIEAEFAWRPIENWSVIGNVAGLHTQYDEYLTNGINIADKQRFAAAPNGQAGLNLEYATPVSFGGNVRARVGYTYQTRVFPTTDLSHVIAQGPYGLLGATLIWNRDAHWTFALQGSNLANKSYRTDGYNIPALGVLTGFYGAPRMVFGSVKYTF
ncbi:MAG: TonB-dependent receptor [Proteobacteria bacterium]|nr:TonB-dependent receptor [Pseudomonadota bacterium]